MENLSTILTNAKNKLEANFCYDDKLNFTGHSYFEIDGYNIEFITNEEHTKTDFIIKNKENNNIIYSKSITAVTNAQQLFDLLDKEIIIHTAVEHIEQGWKREWRIDNEWLDYRL